MRASHLARFDLLDTAVAGSCGIVARVSELLEACRAAPDDDAPRLVWADAIGGERGELVVLQCSPSTPARRERTRELLAAHGAAWSGLAGLARRCAFRRGFVEAIDIDLVACSEHADVIAARAPLLDALVLRCPERTHWEDGTIEGPDTVALVGGLLDHPAFARVRELVFDKAQLTVCPDRESAYQSGYGNQLAALVARRCPALRALGFVDCRLWKDGLAALARAANLEQLVLAESFVDWDWHDAQPPPIAWDASALPALRRLYVRAIDDATRARLRPSIEVIVGLPPDDMIELS